MFKIVKYNAQWQSQWDAFIEDSKNGTFLFKRDYMDYHSHRFTDHSLLFLLDEKLFAVLPANIADATLYSHQGLTYGGLIMGDDTTTSAVVTLFTELRDYLQANGIRRMVYKKVPWIYSIQPAEEDLFAMMLVHPTTILSREVSSTINLINPLRWSHSRRTGINKARNNGVIITETTDYKGFWQVLTDNLKHAHNVTPVHSLDEILLLRSRFPEHIRLFTATKDGRTLGGTVVYDCHPVIHTQYIAANEEGKSLRVVDAIFHHLLHDFDWSNHGYNFLDIGISTIDHGRKLNDSLIYQKEGFGARAICYDTYEWEI